MFTARKENLFHAKGSTETLMEFLRKKKKDTREGTTKGNRMLYLDLSYSKIEAN
jgi:hypothetical protein